MADSILGLSHEHVELVHAADKCGLGGGAVITLLQQLGQTLGPVVAQILIQALQNRNKMGAAPGAGLDVTLIKKLLVATISSHKADVLSFLNDQESALLDLIVQKLS